KRRGALAAAARRADFSPGLARTRAWKSRGGGVDRPSCRAAELDALARVCAHCRAPATMTLHLLKRLQDARARQRGPPIGHPLDTWGGKPAEKPSSRSCFRLVGADDA